MSTALTNTIEGTELDNLLITNLASKMAAKLSFQSNLEFTVIYTILSIIEYATALC